MTGERSEDEWVQVLIEAIKTGVQVDPGGEDLGILEAGMDVCRAEVAPTAAELKGWGTTRQISATALRKALLEPSLTPDPRGLQIYGARIHGPLNLVGAHLSHRLVLARCHLVDPIHAADLHVSTLAMPGCQTSGVDLDGAQISNILYLNGLIAIGRVRALGIHIGGQLALQRAILRGAKEPALSLDGAQIGRSAFMDELIATGGVRALNAHIGGSLTLQNAVLNNGGGLALAFDGAEIEASVHMKGMTATGGVRAHGVRIKGQLAVRSVQLRGPLPEPKDPALSDLYLHSAEIGEIILGDTLAALDLSLCRIGTLTLSGSKSPRLQAAGWAIGSLRVAIPTCKTMIGWLDQKTGFASQAWHEAADALARDGHIEEATRLRIAAAKRSRRALRQKGTFTGWARWLLRLGYGAAVGFGYRPLRAGLWLAAFGLAAWLIIGLGASHLQPARAATPVNTSSAMQVVLSAGPLTGATSCEDARAGWGYPCPNFGLFAVETALPVVGGSQSAAWTWSPAAWPLALLILALKALSWLFTVLLLGGVTNLLRKG